MASTVFAFIGAPGPMEMMIIAGIALLLFGKRLPEVARSMGKGIVEFKKGIAGVEDEVNRSVHHNETSYSSRPLPPEERAEVTAPKFDPPAFNPEDHNSES